MQLTFPFSLIWLLIGLPLVGLYLLKTRPQREPVSSLLYWHQVKPENSPRRWWRRLRQPLSLLLQLLIVTLLIAALTEPVLGPSRQPRRLLVVVDNSASMGATDVTPTRHAESLRLASRLIEQMGPADQMALATGAVPQILTGLTSHKPTLRQQLGRIRSTDAPNELPKAIDLLRSSMGESLTYHLIVITDSGGRAQVSSHVSEEPAGETAGDIQWCIVGTPAKNVAITQFQTRRQVLDPTGFECLIEVTNFAHEGVQCRVEIEFETTLQDVLPLRLDPGEPVQRVVQYNSVNGGPVTARLRYDDVLDRDNVAVALVPPRKPRRVQLASPGNHYLQQVLTAIPLVELDVVEQIPDAGGWEGIPIIHRLDCQRLPAGRSMVIQPTTSNSVWQIGPQIPTAVVQPTDASSSLLAHVQLNDFIAIGSRQLQLRSRARLLVETTDGNPICAIVPHDDGEVLLLNVSLEQGDFPWRTVFPLLMTNAVNWLVGQDPSFQVSYATGEVVDLGDLQEVELQTTMPKQATLTVLPPQGPVRIIDDLAESVRLGPLEFAGIWTLRFSENDHSDRAWAAESEMRIACNLMNAHESDLRVAANEARTEFLAENTIHPPWFWILVATMVLATVEWWLYQRRWVA